MNKNLPNVGQETADFKRDKILRRILFIANQLIWPYRG